MILGDKWIDKVDHMVIGNQPILGEVVKHIFLINSNFNMRTEPMLIFTDNELRQLIMSIMMFASEMDVMINSKKSVEIFSRLLRVAA